MYVGMTPKILDFGDFQALQKLFKLALNASKVL